MAGLPTPKSYEQLLGDMINTYMSKIGVNDLNTGSAVLSFFEAMAQAVYRSSGDTFAILRDFSVDRAEGEALKRLQKEERVYEIPARVATGRVTITDSSITKKSTKVYAGSISPNVGSTVIKVSDASEFNASGTIYIGRGTPNIEGPLAYSSITPIGGYYEINLSGATTKFHNLSETVVMGQGGTRTIPVGYGVKTVASGSSPDVTFTITQKAIILDGEDTIDAVPVTANEPGADGNVPKGAIRQFVTAPFAGASVTNNSPFTTGKNEETDDEIRNRIKKQRISRGLGTAVAVKNAVLGIQSDEENTVVTSNEIFSDGEDTVLFIDNGTGYEEASKGTGLEFIVDSALGGETHFQLSTGGSQTSIAKAFLESANAAPYDISAFDRVAISVGGVFSEHEFKEGDFRSDGFASAYEIVSSINSNTDLLFTARTSKEGTKVTVSAKSETDEYLQTASVTNGGDVSLALAFPTNEIKTLRIYRDKTPLNKNGKDARLESDSINNWTNAIADGDTLIVAVDGTNPITYVFTDLDFINEGTYPTVKNTNNIDSWVNVINAKVVGLTASASGNILILTSNLSKSSRAQIAIDPSCDFVVNGIFPEANGLGASGDEIDYIFSRNTGQFKLLKALEPGESLTAGTEFTNASISSDALLGGSITLLDKAYLWFLVDSPNAEVVNHIVAADTVVDFTKEAFNVVKFKSAVPNSFAAVEAGDYVVLWSDEMNAGNKIEGRVQEVGTEIEDNDFFKIRLTSDEYALATDQTSILFQEGLSFVRNSKPPQKISHESGVYDINVLANNLSAELEGASINVKTNEFLIAETQTKDNNGSVMVLTFNASGKLLNFTEGDTGYSIDSQTAFHQSGSGEGDFPLFVNSAIAFQDVFADTPEDFVDSFWSGTNLTRPYIAKYVKGNEIISFLDSIINSESNSIPDSQIDGEMTQINSLDNTIVNVAKNKMIRSLRAGNRYYVSAPLDFGHNDSIVVILDKDNANKTFPIPLYRRAIANTTKTVDVVGFRAYDVDSGASAEFSTAFNGFDFTNYKALMQAKNVIDPSGSIAEDAILFRSIEWGLESENFKVGYIYPSGPDNGISHTVTVDQFTTVKISLKSGPPITNTIDGTTEWDVSVTPNTPVAGVEEVSYTFTGTGTTPNLGTVVAGNYVTINSNGEFDLANIGTFKISSATATSFAIRRPSGSAVVETNIATLEVNTISLYENDDTEATEIVDYVNEFALDHITAELVDDAGDTGAGIINSSTYEDTSFVTDFVQLVDGINYIASSDVNIASPDAQFLFKYDLSLASFDTITTAAYAFNDGEEVRLIPTTIKQLAAFMSVLAVSGITTLGTVETAQRETRLQIGTQVLGSEGAVEVSGGTGNGSGAIISGTTTDINGTEYCKTNISRSSASGFHAGQWIKIESESFQKKDTGINELTGVSIETQSPQVITSTISLENKGLDDIFFGDLRNNVREIGRRFKVEKHGDLVCITHDNITTTPHFIKLVETNDDSGDMSVEFNTSTGLTEYTVVSGTRNFTEVQINDSLTVTGFVNDANNGSFIVYNTSDDGSKIAVKNFNGVTEAATTIAAGDFDIITQLQEGDTVIIGEPFNFVNQGQFRIIKTYGRSFYIDNPGALVETVTIAHNDVSIGHSTNTEFNITTAEDMRFEWTGNGIVVNPSIKRGDYVTIDANVVNVDNSGTFLVNNVHLGEYETYDLTFPSGADITDSQYFFYDSRQTARYIWFNKGVGSDPAIGGRTGTEVNILNTDSSQAVASKVQDAIDAHPDLSSTVANSTVSVTVDDLGDVPDAVNVDVGGDFIITITNQGSLPYFDLANAKAVAESGIIFSSVTFTFEAHNPTFQFSPYENTVAGDKFIVSGDVLGVDNQGDYEIIEVLNRSSISVSSAMTNQSSVILDDKFTQLYVEEGVVYSGYKYIYGMSVDPANNNKYCMVLEPNIQSNKINQSSSAAITAMSKLGFTETLRTGLDSYKYNTGLIAEANRTIYGDPRDSITYPGVSAAGAEIFTQAPLVRRIEVAISVRLNTGIPFSRITELVRNNIASLINSSPIGQSIAISSIIASVNKIQGVKAIAISSPSYSVTNDLIIINPAEKPFVLDAVNDISVSKID